jgi:hypothetical protein
MLPQSLFNRSYSPFEGDQGDVFLKFHIPLTPLKGGIPSFAFEPLRLCASAPFLNFPLKTVKYYIKCIQIFFYGNNQNTFVVSMEKNKVTV